MKKVTVCPFCGTEGSVVPYNDTTMICNKCERFIYEDTIERENLRHQISAFLSAEEAFEENPLKFTSYIGEGEAFGLSSLELPEVTGAFHDNEGIIWFNIYGCKEPIEFDNLDTDDLRTISVDILQQIN